MPGATATAGGGVRGKADKAPSRQGRGAGVQPALLLEEGCHLLLVARTHARHRAISLASCKLWRREVRPLHPLLLPRANRSVPLF